MTTITAAIAAALITVAGMFPAEAATAPEEPTTAPTAAVSAEPDLGPVEDVNGPQIADTAPQVPPVGEHEAYVAEQYPRPVPECGDTMPEGLSPIEQTSWLTEEGIACVHLHRPGPEYPTSSITEPESPAAAPALPKAGI